MKQLKINNQFVTQKKISQGSFGIVMQGMDQKNGNQVAIKIERLENENTHSIDREVDILSRLNGVEGIPKLLYYGWEDNNNVIVMELLNRDLASLIKSRKKFSLKTTLQISIELVQILERVHERGVLHRDLKPENMMIDESNKVYLIDFGISKIFVRKNGIIIPFKDKVSFVGTSRYASIAAHKGYELGRKDDLESLLYVMLFFVRGNLPWQNLKHVADEQRTHKIGEMKETIDPKDLLKDLPGEFQKIYDYLRKITYATEPDYKAIVRLFQQAAKSTNILLDYKYDWDAIPTEKDIARYGTLQIEGLPLKQFEKFASNVNISRNSNVVAQTPSKLKQLYPPIGKQDSNSNSNSGNNHNLSIYNSMGIIYQLSVDEISEDAMEVVPDERKISIHLQALPDHLKKPNIDEVLDEAHLSDQYNRLQSLSVQVTQILHFAKK